MYVFLPYKTCSMLLALELISTIEYEEQWEKLDFLDLRKTNNAGGAA